MNILSYQLYILSHFCQIYKTYFKKLSISLQLLNFLRFIMASFSIKKGKSDNFGARRSLLGCMIILQSHSKPNFEIGLGALLTCPDQTSRLPPKPAASFTPFIFARFLLIHSSCFGNPRHTKRISAPEASMSFITSSSSSK